MLLNCRHEPPSHGRELGFRESARKPKVPEEIDRVQERTVCSFVLVGLKKKNLSLR